MGPRSDNRGYGRDGPRTVQGPEASMGPRSDNRGYVAGRCTRGRSWRGLQWVRGPITAVMPGNVRWATRNEQLQWVRGPITAVMQSRFPTTGHNEPRFNGSAVR